MRAIFWALALLLLSGAAEAKQYRVIISNDDGGDPTVYLDRAKRRDLLLELRGECNSACTMYLSNPRTCVHPDAILGFHAAYYVGSVSPSERKNLQRWNDYSVSLYPLKVQKWLLKNGGLSKKMLFLQGEELAATVPICPPPPPKAYGGDLTSDFSVWPLGLFYP